MNERAQMWFNMLWNLPLGAVVESDSGTTVWEKRGQDCWMRTGSSSEYDTRSVGFPVRVLREGIKVA